MAGTIDSGLRELACWWYWVVNSQEWNTYNLWARDHIDFGAPHQVPLLWILITNVGESFGYLHVQGWSVRFRGNAW
jgi:hypothetical protein